jgi:hypothetical protein
MFFVKYRYWDELVVHPEWWMIHIPRQRRCMRCFSMVTYERIRYHADKYLEREYGKLVRGKRNPYQLNSWNHEKFPTCCEKKSWKKLYKVSKQWQKPKYEDERFYEIIDNK